MKKIFTILTSLALALSLLVVIPGTATATCSTLSISFSDGAGRVYTIVSTGTCSNPSFAKSDLDNVPVSACSNAFGLLNQDLNDCLNAIRFNGPWPSRYTFFAYRHANFGTLDDEFWACSGIGIWRTLSPVDTMSSFIVQPVTGTCT